MLEILSDFAVTIPELGTIMAERPPVAILTSNRTREVHDALKRRCLYFYIEHPSFEREVEIVRLRVPDAEERLARQVAAATEKMRTMDLYKPPGVAETLDWTEALVALGARELDEPLVEATLGSVLKYREDQQRAANSGLAALVGGVGGQGEMQGESRAPPMLDAAVAFGRVLGGRVCASEPTVSSSSRAPWRSWTPRAATTCTGRGGSRCLPPRGYGGLRPRLRAVLGDRGRRQVRRPSPKVRLSMPQPDRSVMPPKKTVEKSEGGEEAVRLATAPSRCCAARTSPSTRRRSSPNSSACSPTSGSPGR